MFVNIFNDGCWWIEEQFTEQCFVRKNKSRRQLSTSLAAAAAVVEVKQHAETRRITTNMYKKYCGRRGKHYEHETI